MNRRHQQHLHAAHATAHKERDPGDPSPRTIPPKPADMPWRDYLIMLLHIGAELEHGLMVQYLYAAYSLGGEQVPVEHRHKVEEWRELILTVAKEEMGHLLTVQNLLCLVGGPVSFDREDFPWDTPFYPFPFKLEPLSKASIGKYVFAEMPNNFEALEACFSGKNNTARERKFGDKDLPWIEHLMAGWVEEGQARPVGEVYHLILDLLSDPERIKDSDLRPESFALQASWDDWGRGYKPGPARPGETDPPKGARNSNVIILRMATRTEALHALREIAGQGEAADLKLEDNKEPSHFDRFVKLFEEFEDHEDEGWHPVRPVAVNPSTITNAKYAPPDVTPIMAESSRLWASLFNVRYRLLLSYLTHTFRLAREVNASLPNTRGAVMHRIFGEMYNIKTISGILVRMPLGDPKRPETRAGPPFQVPYTLDLPLDPVDCWRLHRDNLTNSIDLCGTLLDPQRNLLADTPSEGDRYLKILRNLDAQSVQWIDQVLDGLRAVGEARP